MRKTLLALAICAGALGAGQASAALVDFRTQPFHAGNNRTSFNVGVNGTTFHFEAAPWGSRLYHDYADGFGVKSWVGPEHDEIEGKEILSLSFWEGRERTALGVESVLLTDLFNEATRETARLQLFTTDGIRVIQVDAARNQVPGHTNGELWVQLGGLRVHEIRFSSPGRVNGNWEEFSVAGLITTTPMPEPSAAVAFCVGSLVIAAALRRRREETYPG